MRLSPESFNRMRLNLAIINSIFITCIEIVVVADFADGAGLSGAREGCQLPYLMMNSTSLKA
jgi:hypothetical protein